MLPKLLIFLVLHIALSMIYFYYTILLIIVQDLFQYFSHFIFKHLISCDNSLGGSMNYKDQMKRIRDYNGLSQKNVAEILHIARSTYNQFEQQYDIIPLKHLNNFCNHFKISVDYVFNLTLEKKYVDEIEEIIDTEKANPNKGIIEAIDKKIQFNYENSNLASVSAKRTASSLDDSVKNFDYFASSKPAFMNDGEMTPGEKGTAMHAFMQFCDYANAKNNLENEILRLTENAFITREQADSLNRESLSELFNSDFADRMFNSDKIYRELKISSFVKARDIEDIDSDEEILIQGISDCVFEENGELVLVDYKTDRVKSEKQLLSMYENQIAFYKNAVAKALGKNVKEAVLYSFKLGKVCHYK